MSDAPYTPPKVWDRDKESGGRFASINRPIAGPTHEKELPIGKHPLQLYSLATPNGVKVTIMLEELLAPATGRRIRRLAHPDQRGRAVRQRLRRRQPEFEDPGADGPQRTHAVRVFESGAILLHLAEKFGAFLPKERRGARRVPVVAVLADGQRTLPRRRLRPLLRLCADQDRIRHRPLRDGGQAPARRPRPAARRQRVSRRQGVHDRGHRRVALVRRAREGRVYGAGEFLRGPEYKNVQRWTDAIGAATRREARADGQSHLGDPSSQLHERHDASDFETKTQDKLAPKA